MGDRTLKGYQDLVLEFLKTKTVDEIKPYSRPPITVKDDISPLEGFQTLAENNIRACPVWSDRDKAFIGTLDLRDVCKLFVEVKKHKKEQKAQKHKHFSAISENEEDKPAMPVDELVAEQNIKPDSRKGRNLVLETITKHPTIVSDSTTLRYIAKMRPLRRFEPDTSLMSIADALAEGSHLVAINGEGENSKNGIGMVITQKMLFQVLSPVLEKIKLRADSIMKSPVISIRASGPSDDGENTLDVTEMTIEDFVVQVRKSKPSAKTCATVCSVHKVSPDPVLTPSVP
eukprot:768259-Hanusia_phi.AAC.9